MRLPDRLLNALVAVMTVAAVATVALRVYRATTGGPGEAGAEERSDWRRFTQAGIVVGNENAPVTLVVFSDFECPFCRMFADSLSGLLSRHEGRLRLVFRNLPLSTIHRSAEPAAKAAICAAEQDRFLTFHDEVFSSQDTIGRVNWVTLAAAVGVSDTADFSRCLASETVASRLAADREAAAELNATGTPTFLINSFLVRGLPRTGVLDSLVMISLGRTVEER